MLECLQTVPWSTIIFVDEAGLILLLFVGEAGQEKDQML